MDKTERANIKCEIKDKILQALNRENFEIMDLEDIRKAQKIIKHLREEE